MTKQVISCFGKKYGSPLTYELVLPGLARRIA